MGVCTVTVDMATITEAVTVDTILPMEISMGDMVVILKDILSHTHNTRHMANLKLITSPKHMFNPTVNLKRISNHQPIVNHKPIVNYRPLVKLKVMAHRRPILNLKLIHL